MPYTHYINLASQESQSIPMTVKHRYYFNSSCVDEDTEAYDSKVLVKETRKIKQFVLFHTVDVWLTRDLNKNFDSLTQNSRHFGQGIQNRDRLFASPWTVAYQAPPSMGFPRQEYWSGVPFPSPGDLPDPGIEPRSPVL